ncbi:hypothetical protein LSAT2_021329 [Lamellibrachia satsuma]|nr:hypothetical protein LSAT2_021329 [Lamellibrachia satsuma]
MAPNNALPIHGNEKTMNLNTLLLTNIQSSPYFKVNLYELKTYHEVIDEIYYKVNHLEPWEKGSRKTAGQTGMCGGVRGVGAGGIVSSAFCLLYKLFTLKLTRKQVVGLITHSDSPYIRGLGFMYIRYTQPPPDLWDWYEPYLEDEEEIDVKAGSGHIMTMGEMVKQWIGKLEWYGTLFPRIPVPIQKDIERKMKAHLASTWQRPAATPASEAPDENKEDIPESSNDFGEAASVVHHHRSKSPSSRKEGRHSDKRTSPHFDGARNDRDRPQKIRTDPHHRDRRRRSRSLEHRSRDKPKKDIHRSHGRSRSRDRDRKRSRSPRDHREPKRSDSRERHRHRHRSLSRERVSESRHKHDSREARHRKTGSHGSHRESSFDHDLKREKHRHSVKNGV